jgi:hypothetical protein
LDFASSSAKRVQHDEVQDTVIHSLNELLSNPNLVYELKTLDVPSKESVGGFAIRATFHLSEETPLTVYQAHTAALSACLITYTTKRQSSCHFCLCLNPMSMTFSVVNVTKMVSTVSFGISASRIEQTAHVLGLTSLKMIDYLERPLVESLKRKRALPQREIYLKSLQKHDQKFRSAW